MDIPLFSTALYSTFALILVHLLVEATGKRWSHPLTSKLGLGYSVFSFILFLFSLYAFCQIVPSAATTEELPREPLYEFIYAVYFLSKVWELQDLVFGSLRGLPIPMLSHFRIHHYTTLLLAWCVWRSRSYAGMLFITLNAFMHTWVYLYHNGYPTKLVFVATRAMQPVQLLGGLIGGVVCACVRLQRMEAPAQADDVAYVACQCCLSGLCALYGVMFIALDLPHFHTAYFTYPPRRRTTTTTTTHNGKSHSS